MICVVEDDPNIREIEVYAMEGLSYGDERSVVRQRVLEIV